VFKGANSYTGDTFVNAGTLQFDTGGSLPSGNAIRIGDTTGTNPATLALISSGGGLTLAPRIVVRAGSSGVKTISATNTGGTNAYSGNVFLDDDATTSSAAGGTLAFTSAGSFDIKNHKLTVSGSGTTIFSTVIGNSVASGSIVLSGAGTTIFSGTTSNSFGASVTINSGTLILSKSAGVDAIGNMPITLSGGTLLIGASNQINDAASVTIGSGGVFNVNGNNEAFGGSSAGITVNGGTILVPGGSLNPGSGFFMNGGTVITSGAGFLKLNSGPAVNNTTDGSTAAVIIGTLSLNGANRAFTVNHSSGVSLIDADVQANIIDSSSGHDLTKTGTGVLRLGGSNSYSGNTIINRGTLSISADNNLGSVPASFNANALQFGSQSSNGGALRVTADVSLAANRGITLFSNAGTIDATGGNLTIGGPIANSGFRLTVTGANTITLAGGLSGTGDVLKQGSGTVRFTTANSFGSTNNLFADKGNIEVAASGALGTTNGTTTGLVNLGASNSAPAGDISLLITAAGVTVANPIDSRFFTGVSGGKTIGGANSSGTASYTGGLTLHDNTTLSAAAGGLVTFGAAIVTGVAGSPTVGEAVNTAPPTGGFGTGPGLLINTSSTDGGIVELTGASTYTGDTVVNSGTLQFNGSFSSASTIRLGASSGSVAAAINVAKSAGATFVRTINVRPGSSGVKTISSTNLSGTVTYSGHLALDDSATILSSDPGATLAITQLRSTPADTGTGFDIKGFTATVSGSGNTLISGTIYNSTGNGNLSKQGSGALTLSGSNTYSGNTTISSGKLLVTNTTGSATGSSNVSISALLAGNGAISGDTTFVSGAQVSPGDFGASGKLSVGNFTLASSVTLQVEVGGDHSGTPGLTFDQIAVTGSGKTFVVGGANLAVIPLGSVELNVPYRIVDATGNTVNAATKFANLLNGVSYDDGNVKYAVTYNPSSIDVTFTAVPEPTSMAVFGAGITFGLRRRARRG
jgi:autotransporter-associated beta strand protein